MKTKIIKFLKLSIYTILFVLIYVYITTKLANSYEKDIVKLDSKLKLDSLVNGLLLTHFKDSIHINDIKVYKSNIDSIDTKIYDKIESFLSSKSLDSTTINNFNIDFALMLNNYQNDIISLNDNIYEYNNLKNRFPSNIVLTNKF